jgi:hypothetical protein
MDPKMTEFQWNSLHLHQNFAHSKEVRPLGLWQRLLRALKAW